MKRVLATLGANVVPICNPGDACTLRPDFRSRRRRMQLVTLLVCVVRAPFWQNSTLGTLITSRQLQVHSRYGTMLPFTRKPPVVVPIGIMTGVAALVMTLF